VAVGKRGGKRPERSRERTDQAVARKCMRPIGGRDSARQERVLERHENARTAA